MAESIEYNLSSIELLEKFIHPAWDKTFVSVEELLWQFSFSFTFTNHPGKKKGVCPAISYQLYNINDEEQKSITLFKIESRFTVTREISPTDKLDVLNKFLDITLWNLQGIYAEKTAGTRLADSLPPPTDMTEHQEFLKELIADEWR